MRLFPFCIGPTPPFMFKLSVDIFSFRFIFWWKLKFYCPFIRENCWKVLTVIGDKCYTDTTQKTAKLDLNKFVIEILFHLIISIQEPKKRKSEVVDDIQEVTVRLRTLNLSTHEFAFLEAVILFKSGTFYVSLQTVPTSPGIHTNSSKANLVVWIAWSRPEGDLPAWFSEGTRAIKYRLFILIS